MTMKQWEGTSKSEFGWGPRDNRGSLGWVIAVQVGLGALPPQDNCFRTVKLIWGDSWLWEPPCQALEHRLAVRTERVAL